MCNEIKIQFKSMFNQEYNFSKLKSFLYLQFLIWICNLKIYFGSNIFFQKKIKNIKSVQKFFFCKSVIKITSWVLKVLKINLFINDKQWLFNWQTQKHEFIWLINRNWIETVFLIVNIPSPLTKKSLNIDATNRYTNITTNRKQFFSE